MKKTIFYILFSIVSVSAAFASPRTKNNVIELNAVKLDTATFATGCFWCAEAKFKELRGVASVTSGFSGGHTVNPTYEEVSTGTTGHAETVNILFNPKQITYDELVEVFFTDHDPTQLNRQGNDVGTEYRSAIFYHNAAQKQKAEYYIKKINESHAYSKPVVTQVVPFKVFYKAEGYHQNYFSRNGSVPYCKYVIQPELDKFRKVFADKLKKTNN